jgi:hypothetical protein
VEFYQKTLVTPEHNLPKLRVKVVRWLLLRGTLSNLMTATNAIIIGGIVLVALLAGGASLQATAGWTIVAVISAVYVLNGYHYYMRDRLPPMA